MANGERYYIIGETADGTIALSGSMLASVERGYISVLFFNGDPGTPTEPTPAGETPVTPNSGTITFEVSEGGRRYGTITNGEVDATELQYDRPNWSGAATSVRATCNNIGGASHYIATIAGFSSS